MGFQPNQTLHLPELSQRLGLKSPTFKVDGVIKGGMGECVRISQQGEFFALKVIQDELIEDSDNWNRYLRELRLWTTLSACEGVAEAYCIIRFNELPVVCSRWMPGGNLQAHLRNRSPEFFFSVIARIVGTLRWAYDHHKVLHRDLKPGNILLDETGLAFVSDWGLARPLTAKDGPRQTGILEDAPPALTAAGSVLGTVYYASPEQLLGDADLDQRTDIYSLGCLMYEWETGTCPFTGSAEEVQLKHLFQNPRPIGHNSSFGADDAILACLVKDPGKRMPDYSSLDIALADSAKHRGVQYRIFRPMLRYRVPMVGAEEYRHQMHPGGTGTWNKAGTYCVVEKSEIEPFLREADALASIGDFRKAAEIYGSLFVPEAVSAVPDFDYNQHVTINYAHCMIALGRGEEAIKVLSCLAAATEKPADFYVNLSHAQIRVCDFRAAANTASEGLRLYPNDQDLIGNLLVAQSAMGEFLQATETAKARLALKRDVHSLHEVAALHCRYASRVRDLDWPLAVKNLKYAVCLLREAKQLNPRFLPVRLQLPIALEALTAYTQCSHEIGGTKELPLHISDRLILVYLLACCLDSLAAHKECWEFCDSWLKRIEEVQATNPVPQESIIRLERVRAITIADGYCIGRMKDRKRAISPIATEFFAHIVRNANLREADDFCYLARLHEWMEEYEEAYAVLTEGESLYPGHWEFTFDRAALQLRAGDYSGALPNAERAAELAPWKAQSWSLLAKTLESLGRASHADSANRRAEEVQRIRDELADEIDNM